MEGSGNPKKRVEGGENHHPKLNVIIQIIQIQNEGEQIYDVNSNIAATYNKFSADYSRAGTAKCKICKKKIIKDGLRIGMYTAFKGKTITTYHHPRCLFNKMKNARVESSVIKDLAEVDGIEGVSDEDKEIISNFIKENAANRTKPLIESYKKKAAPMEIRPAARRKKLQVLKSTSIKVLFTNADQFSHSKKSELQNRIVTEKPMIVAVSEVKPKNRGGLSEADYSIEDYTVNPVNIDPEKNEGRGMIIYTHKSLEKCTIQISPSPQFEEACLLKI